jgi:hypothetical protein
VSAAVARLRALLACPDDDAADRRGLRDAILFGVYLLLAVVLVSALMGEGVPL